MGVWEEYSQGEGRLQKQVGLYFPLESETRRQDTVLFCKSCQGRSRSTTHLGMSEPDVFLCSFCIVTALLSGPFLRRPLEDIPIGKEDELQRNPLRSLSLVFLSAASVWDTLFLAMLRLLVSTWSGPHTPSAAVLTHFV